MLTFYINIYVHVLLTKHYLDWKPRLMVKQPIKIRNNFQNVKYLSCWKKKIIIRWTVKSNLSSVRTRHSLIFHGAIFVFLFFYFPHSILHVGPHLSTKYKHPSNFLEATFISYPFLPAQMFQVETLSQLLPLSSYWNSYYHHFVGSFSTHKP